MSSIAFIGVGNMGGPMALNLLKAGRTVRVFDLSKPLMEAVSNQGAVACGSAQEAVEGVEAVVSMLPSGKAVESLYLGEGGLLSCLPAGTLVIDCSTIAPDTARQLHQAGAACQIDVLDAPVSGGVGGAQAGTLTFIVGGLSPVVEHATPILQCMGKNIFHAGDAGAGQMAKICNNMLLAIHMTGTAEALQLGVDNGLDPAVLSRIMLQSSGRNWSLELYNPYPGVMDTAPASRGYTGGFQVDLMNKDLGLALEAALSSRSSTPLGTLARTLYALLARRGKGGLDFSSIQTLFQRDV